MISTTFNDMQSLRKVALAETNLELFDWRSLFNLPPDEHDAQLLLQGITFRYYRAQWACTSVQISDNETLRCPLHRGPVPSREGDYVLPLAWDARLIRRLVVSRQLQEQHLSFRTAVGSARPFSAPRCQPLVLRPLRPFRVR